MANLTIIRGLPGSGKSTLARALLSQTLKSYHFEADMYFTDSEGNYKYDAAKIGDAHDWCIERCRSALAHGDSVIVANTFTRIREMRPYLDMQYDKLQVIECHGSFGSIHGVSHNVIENMRNRWEFFTY